MAPSCRLILSFSFTGRPLIARRPVKEKERMNRESCEGEKEEEIIHQRALWYQAPVEGVLWNRIPFPSLSMVGEQLMADQ